MKNKFISTKLGTGYLPHLRCLASSVVRKSSFFPGVAAQNLSCWFIVIRSSSASIFFCIALFTRMQDSSPFPLLEGEGLHQQCFKLRLATLMQAKNKCLDMEGSTAKSCTSLAQVSQQERVSDNRLRLQRDSSSHEETRKRRNKERTVYPHTQQLLQHWWMIASNNQQSAISSPILNEEKKLALPIDIWTLDRRWYLIRKSFSKWSEKVIKRKQSLNKWILSILFDPTIADNSQKIFSKTNMVLICIFWTYAESIQNTYVSTIIRMNKKLWWL